MPIMQGSRLENLLKLRDRLDGEIKTERAKERARERRRVQEARDAEKATKAAQRAAERAANRPRPIPDAERVAIEKAAPADAVRAWARAQGISVGDRGRLSIDLRKQYLDATTPEEGAATA